MARAITARCGTGSRPIEASPLERHGSAAFGEQPVLADLFQLIVEVADHGLVQGPVGRAEIEHHAAVGAGAGGALGIDSHIGHHVAHEPGRAALEFGQDGGATFQHVGGPSRAGIAPGLGEQGGQGVGLAALFTETGRYARPAGPADVLEGRAAILAEFKSRPPRLMRHVVANVTVNAQSPTSASAHSRVVLYLGAPDGTLDKTMVGDFHDQLEKVGEDWLFAERRGSVTLKG